MSSVSVGLVVFGLVVVGSVGVSLGAPLAPDLVPRFDVRSPIEIVGDEGFTRENGVRRGSGTAEDPFVIANWSVQQGVAFAAIRLVGTRAHVVIENVEATGSFGWDPASCVVAWVSGPPGRCEGAPYGVDLRRAENVTLRSARFVNHGAAVHVDSSANVRVEDVASGLRTRHLLWHGPVRIVDSRDVSLSNVSIAAGTRGLFVDRSERVEARGLSIGGSPADGGAGVDVPLTILHSRDVAIRGVAAWSFGTHPLQILSNDELLLEDASFRGRPGAYHMIQWATNATVRNASFSQAHFLLYGRLMPLEFRDSTFAATELEGLGGGAQDIMFCGSRFVGGPDYMTWIQGAGSVSLVGNEMRGNVRPLAIVDVDRAVVENNVIMDSAKGFFVHARTLLARGNLFENNTLREYAPGERYSIDLSGDARGNWWGHASGPSGAGSGQGERLEPMTDETPAFEPWLTERPEPALGCAS